MWSVVRADPTVVDGSVASVGADPAAAGVKPIQTSDEALTRSTPPVVATAAITAAASPALTTTSPPTTASAAPETTALATPSAVETTLGPVIETTVPTAPATVPIQLPEGPVEGFSFEIADDGKAYMRGALPDVATAEAVAAKGAAVVGSDSVVAEYTIDPRVVLDVEQADEGFVTQTLLYPPGAANLQEEHVYPLDQVVVLLLGSPQLAAYIEGYTDGDGDATENLGLSRSRARVVWEYLVRQGVNPAQLIETVGKGEDSPLGDNATETGRSVNRRVDIHLTSLG